MSAEEIVREVAALYPVNICFTGGEPFLQPKLELHDIAWELVLKGKTLEFFSNGTLEYPEWALKHTHITMDWKLPGSGEDPNNVMRLQNLKRMKELGVKHSVKFVVKNRDDYELAKVLSARIDKHLTTIWAGVAWGAMEPSELAEWMQKDQLKWKLNVQVHNYVWDRSQRGI
jgi:7-carboxy-7-deazaguanine synthase